MKNNSCLRLVTLIAALVAVGGAHSSALAAAPKTALVEGFLSSTGGAAAADGSYDITFTIYANSSTTTALWTEGPVKVTVTKGQFAWALGSKTPLNATKLANTATPFLGLKVGADPELPRRPLHSTIYALHAGSAAAVACTGCISSNQIAAGGIAASKVGFTYAGSSTKGGAAKDLACTGCVSVKELKFDANVDLAAYSFKAKNGTFTGNVVAATVTATSFAGDGSKLTGIKTPSGECKNAGEVVKGINADGSLKCVKALDPAALPKDGLNEISNNLLSNQFVDTVETTKKMVSIPDNTGIEAISSITFPNIGVAQTFALHTHIESTDLSAVAAVVLPPDDKKTGWSLCDPCGAKDAKIFKKTYTPTAKPKSGDIAKWVGKNPQGSWTLKVLDTAFCIPQAAGNAKYCNPTGKTDGWIATWYIKIQTLSNQKVALNGDLIVSGGLSFSGAGSIDGDTRMNKNLRVDGFLDQRDGWCPTQPNGEPSVVVGGVCTPGVGSWRNWQSAIDFCKAKGADLCSTAQIWVLRKHGMLSDHHDGAGAYRAHPNSYGDNDASHWTGVLGNFSDDTSSGTSAFAPCCYNSTPKRDTDKIIKVNGSDKGIRLLSVHNAQDTSFHTAAATCAAQHADICTKSELVYLRTAGIVSGLRMWGNDGQDNDGDKEFGSGPLADNVHPYYGYGFACCAGEVTSSKSCPAGATYTDGVCWAKTVNANSSLWKDAAIDCGKLGASVCTISQSAVLRQKGILKSSGNWSAGMGDCDGQCSGTKGLGSVSNDINNSGTNKYGYACCF